MIDTDPKIEALLEKMLLSRSGVERIHMASSMHTTAKALALASLLEKYPRASEADLRGLLFLRFYADDFSTGELSKIYRHLVDSSTPRRDQE